MVEVLTSKDLTKTGGQERWVKDIIAATQDMEEDVQVITDDISLHRADLSKPHLYYMTTPRRSLYDMRQHASPWLKPIIPLLINRDRAMIEKVKNIACISNTVRDRVKRYYGRTSDLIYPCVHCEDYKWRESKGYWLSVQRVDKWKRVEMQLEAFREMPDKRLVIVGPIYPKYQHLVEEAPENVDFLGNLSERLLKYQYSHCEGVLCTSIREDFGIVPLEAMASGKPVVAVDEGGYRETVVDMITGCLVDAYVPDIIEGIEDCPNYPEMCIEQANRFDYEVFKSNLREKIQQIYMDKH